MNFKFNFENVQFEKKAGPIAIGIVALLVVVFSIISIGLFNNYQAGDIKDSEQKAELISMNVSKDLEETVKSISYLSELISSNNLKAKITSEEVTTLLNSLISSDDKIFAAFVLLDKSEYEDLEDLNITNIEEEILDDEDLEDLDDDEDVDDEDEDEDDEEEVKVETKTSVVNGLNKLIFRSGEGTSETTLDRINNLDYKKNYLKVLLSKEPQTMLPLVNSYNGIEKKTITYTMPIIVEGFVEGVIGLDIDTEKLNNDLNSSNDVLNGTYLLLSKDNKVIVSNKEEYVNQSIDEIYGSKKLQKFFEESLESMELSSMKNKTASWLEDNLYITVPVVVNGSHIWNLVVKTTTDKTATNVAVIIFLAIIFNVLAFGLLLVLVYTVFASGMKKKLNGMIDELDSEISKVKDKKKEIYQDIDAITDVDVEEYDDEDDEEIIEQFEATPEEADAKAEETAKDDAALEAMAASVDFDKYEEPKIEEPKIEEPKITEIPKFMQEDDAQGNEAPKLEPGMELEGMNLDDVSDIVDKSVNETLKNEGVPIVDDDGEDKPSAIAEIIESEKSEEPQIEEPKIEEPKIESETPAEGETPVEEVPELSDEERAAQEAEIKKQEELEADLADITENKDGVIENDDFMAEMEAKMDAALNAEPAEPTLPIEEPKIEEPKIEEPKIEEPKIEEPKIEEPKIEEPKIEEPKIEEPKIEEPKIEEPKIEEPKIEEPKIEEPKIEEPKIEEPKIEEPKIEAPKPAPKPAEAPKPEPHRPHRIEDPEPLKKRSADDDDDPYAIRRGPKKLTNKEMDELLKELEAKRAAEDETNGVDGGTGEFTNETTIDSDLMNDLVGKIKGDDEFG